MDSEKAFKFGPIACGLTLAGAILFLSQPCRGDQIVAIVDRYGHKVYVNTDIPDNNPISRAGGGFDFTPSGGNPARAGKIDSMVEQIAGRHQVDPQLVRSVIEVESDYDPRAVSSKGALGLMQLIPATAQRFGVQNPFDARQNVEGGTTYLKYLLNMFGGNVSLALAAYNAGENSVLRSGGIPPIPETRNYVRKVTQLYRSGSRTMPNTRMPGRLKTPEPTPAPIIRYVDAQGVVHFTNTE